MVQDITDRKRAEEALRQSEEKYRTILENIQEAYYEMNLAGNFTFVNDTICRHLGYSREELIGMNYRQYQDETTAEKMYQLYKKVYETGKPIEILDAELVRKDGTKGIYEMSVSLIRDSEGKPVGFRGVSREVTERKQMERALRQSEEKYRTILENIEDGYYEVDLVGNFTFFNDSMCRILGYPKEELMGMNNQQYADKEVARKVFQAFNKVYKTGEPGREFDWEIVRKDGTKRYIETSVSLRKDASDKPAGFRGIVRDVTDRKRIEEQLFQAEKLRAVGEMASGVAHDFNNALAAILGNTQLLLYTAQDEELKETLKIIEQVAKDSGQTVRRLQDFTRRRVPQELFKVDINSIIKDSIEITKPRWKDEAQSRGIRIEIVSNLEDIPFASGNASELREVITNMIFNAIEAMHEGGKVEIRTFKKRRDIFIQISDTGVGIAEEAKKRIFEPFFTTKPFSNTGLGLSMSYGIVKRFGGEIEVESKVGQGTTFTIILPIGEEGKEEAVDPQTIKKGRKARILVIDDEEFVRSVLSRTLAQADHQVTLAEDGRKGVQLFKEGKFDIVLTDLGMPGVSGWEVCRMIKEVSPRTPVGMITGWGDERNRSKMEEYGLDFFISKPFDFAQILNVVAETMESKEE
jgi:PAS domain S-box-containing protein